MAHETFVERVLDLPGLIRKKSHFLFGPRQTGKSFLIRHTLPGVRLYDLLDHATYLALSQRPGRIAEELTATDRVVVIDEIQRLPELLNEVQRLIEERGIRFILTGSSARKLRRGGVNLLGGRASHEAFYPFMAGELGGRFHLDDALQIGLIPGVLGAADRARAIEAYCDLYLREEVQAERLV